MSAEEDLKALVAGIPEFASWTPMQKITLFAWVQHSLRKLERFGTTEIGWCFETLNYKEAEYRSDAFPNGGGRTSLRCAWPLHGRQLAGYVRTKLRRA